MNKYNMDFRIDIRLDAKIIVEPLSPINICIKNRYVENTLHIGILNIYYNTHK